MLKVLVNRATGKERTYDFDSCDKERTNNNLVDSYIDNGYGGYTANHWYYRNLFCSYHTAIGFRVMNVLLLTEEKYSTTTSTIQNKIERAFLYENPNHLPRKVFKVPQEVINHFAFDEYDYGEIHSFLTSCILEGKDKLDYDDYKYILSL